MSGRIRSIKPELLEDAVTAGLSHEAFRLFVGGLLLADDHGRLRAETRWLEAQIFWGQPNQTPVADVVQELASARLWVLYSHDGQRYAEVRTWAKHQKVDRPGKPRIPPPSEHSRDPREDSRDSRETVASPRETLATDLRSPISDLRPPTTDPRVGDGSENTQGGKAETTPAPTATPVQPQPMGSGFFGLERDWFAEGVGKALGRPFVRPEPSRSGVLLEILHLHGARNQAAAQTYLVTESEAFARATEGARQYWPLTHGHLSRWLGEGKPSAEVLAKRGARGHPKPVQRTEDDAPWLKAAKEAGR